MRIDLRERYDPFPRQILFHEAPQKFKLFGGAMSGGKTYAACAEALSLSLQYPGNRGVFIRKTLKSIKRTTLVTFLKVCPPELIQHYNRNDLEITLINGSTILFIEGDISRDPDQDKLKGLEVGWFVMEEANEMDEKVFRIATTRLRWSLPTGGKPKFFGICTCNPEESWVKSRFVDQQISNHIFVPSLPSDNPYNDEGYIEDMMNVLTESEIERYIKGNWDTKDDPNQLIQFKWIKAAEYDVCPDIVGEQSLGVDVARYGDDLSTWSHLIEDDHEMALKQIQEFAKMDTHTYSKAVLNFAMKNRIKADRIAVDGVGLGAGVIDNLRADNLRVKEFISGAKPARERSVFTFRNLRSQGYWHLRTLLKDEKLSIPKHQRLREDMTAHRYKIDGDRMITIGSKDEIKKKLGFSPDYSDSLMMGCSTHLVSTTKISKAVVF